MRLLTSIAFVWLAFLTATAWAEDFTGFYAGVNAGYAHGRASDGSAFAKSPGFSGQAAETGLPPSATSAANRMEPNQAGKRRNGASGTR